MLKPAALSKRVATFLIAAAGAGFLYAGGPSGKEARAADDCAAAGKVAEAVKTLATGEIAALNLSKDSREDRRLRLYRSRRQAGVNFELQGQAPAAERLGDLVRALPRRNAGARQASGGIGFP